MVKSFEDSLEELEAVVERLEGGQLSLDECLGLFERGIKLTRECASRLREAEMRIETLVEENGEFITRPL